MKHFQATDFQDWDRRYRANFFNSAGGFKSANLIGTYNEEGVANLALFFSVIHVGANPPYLGLLFRPHSVPRHSLENLLAQGCFSVNAVSAPIYRQAHAASAKYEAGRSEFEACGLSHLPGRALKVPYVAESPLRLGCTFAERQDLQVNGTIFIVGKIEEAWVEESLLQDDGFLDLAAARGLAINNLDAYYQPQLLNRLAYAEPDTAVREIDQK